MSSGELLATPDHLYSNMDLLSCYPYNTPSNSSVATTPNTPSSSGTNTPNNSPSTSPANSLSSSSGGGVGELLGGAGGGVGGEGGREEPVLLNFNMPLSPISSR